MKKLLKLLPVVALVAVLSCVALHPTEAHAASTSDLTFCLNSDRASYYVYECKESATGALTIPATYNGKPVTAVGKSAFDYCSSLTSVTISKGITTIGERAFYNCSNLQSVTIPDGVTEIGEYAFCFCQNLTSVSIPYGVTTMEFRVFEYCFKLTSVKLPSSITTIEEDAFYSCHKLTDITIPYSVTSIGKSAFSCCDSLTSISIPDSVTSIGVYAFNACKSLTSITIPASVTSIDDWAFTACTNLNGIWVDRNNPNYSSDTYGVLYNKDKTELIQAPGTIANNYTIPNSVTIIGDRSFYGSAKLTSITIPDNVTSISNEAFYNCVNLTSATIGGCVTEIGEYAFGFCEKLSSITIPGSVTAIDQMAFRGCDKLSHIYYTGTRDQWDGITIGKDNNPFIYATLHFTQCETNGHTEEILPDKTVTCTESGLTKGKTCSVCGEILVSQEVIPAPGHSEEILPGKAATCTATGLTEGKKCTVCNDILVAQNEIPAPGHTEEILPAKAATCTEAGLTEGKKCAVCGEILVAQEVISAPGHAEECLPSKAATCTETGLTEGKKCAVCEEVLVAQEEIPAIGHSYDHDFDASCNVCGAARALNNTYKFENYRVVFADTDTTHKNLRVEVYNLGEKTVANPADEKALKAIDSAPATYWGISHINKILITDAGNYVLLLKYNIGTGAATKVPLTIRVSSNPKLIIDKNNKLTAIDKDGANINHRAVVYYLGDQTVEDIYDEAALTAIDSAPETHWQKTRINRLALTKGGNYVLHLCYNVGTGAKQTVAQQFTVESIPTLSVDINNKVVVTEENAENKNHRAVVYFLGENTVDDPYDESAVKAAAISTSKTYWGLSEINKQELKEGGNYVIHLYYNVGTSEKRTLALGVTLNERPALSVGLDNKLVVTYTDPEINNLRAYIYNVGDNAVSDIYDEAALKKIATPTQVWGLSSILKKQLTPGTYVVHLYYSVGTSAKKTVALKVTI